MIQNDNQILAVDSNEIGDSQRTCGIGPCTPAWLQKFSNPEVFLCLFSLVGIIQGAYFTYFSGILSTLQKRYAFDSFHIGLIFIADNISHAPLFSILVGYYGKFVNRPRLLACGMLITVLSCFVSSMPNFIYGRKTVSHFDIVEAEQPQLCADIRTTSNQKCNRMALSESNTAIGILFIANFLNGCGSLIYYTIGITYLDDNVKKKRSPLYLGMWFSSRVVGPTVGFYLSSICLKLYEDPFMDPGFSNNDPSWIGSWWIGFLLIGIILAFVSLPIALFPKSLKNPACEVSKEPLLSNSKKMKDIFLSLKKLVKNPIFMCHTLSITFQINGIFGYYTFMAKYMENQYQQSASKASFFSGTTVLVTTMVSILLGSCVIQIWKPKPKILVGYMVFVELFATAGLMSALFFGCPMPQLHEFQNQNCARNCDCSEDNFSPVCGEDKMMFYSPCHAGCSSYTEGNISMTFHNCSCSSRAFEIGMPDVKRGFCDIGCNNFWRYFIFLTLSKIFAFTAKVGNCLITLRCVPEEEKALALSVVEFFISIFATIPYPLIYGYVIDGTCLVWEKNCGKMGNCLLYDNDKFRNHFHILSICFLSVGTIFELVVFCLSKNLKDLYGNKDKENCRSDNVETSHM